MSGFGVRTSGGGGADRAHASASTATIRQAVRTVRVTCSIVRQSARAERKIDPVRLVLDRKSQPHHRFLRRDDGPAAADPALPSVVYVQGDVLFGRRWASNRQLDIGSHSRRKILTDRVREV